MLTKNFSRFAVFLVDEGDEQMLGRNKLVLHLVRLLLRSGEHLAETRTEILLAALDARMARHGRLCVVKNDRNVRAQLTENWSNDTFGLLEHRNQQVLWFNLLVLISLSQLDGRLDCFLDMPPIRAG